MDEQQHRLKFISMDNRRDRKTRKRGFDDEFSQTPSPWETRPALPSYGGTQPSYGTAPPMARPQGLGAPGGPEVTATVKWYTSDKGFGFVEVAGGDGDAFLHASVLQRGNHADVKPGDILKVRVAPGQKGNQVTDVISVTPGEAPDARAPRSFDAPRPNSVREYEAPRVTEEVRGVVKWYNTTKGFGFVSPDNGGKDIFIHVTALQRSNVSGLVDGQSVTMQVSEGKKGPEASSIRV